MLKKETLFNESHIQKLVKEFQGGNRRPFIDIWQRVHPYISRLMKDGLDYNTARDLTSQVCTRLYAQGLKQYQPYQNVSFISWLHKFACAIKIDELRRKKPANFSELAPNRGDNNEEDYSVVENLAVENRSPLSILIGKEDEQARQKALRLLPECLNKLSPEERLVLSLSIYDKLTDKDISVILAGDEGSTNNYCQMRIRALKKLSKLFGKCGIKDIPVKSGA